jgi:Tfp pilus assembly protein PilX
VTLISDEDDVHTENLRASAQRGAALVAALLVLLVLLVVSSALVTTSVVSTQISGLDQRRAEALDLAEAGVAEAVSRIRSGEVPGNDNPRMVAQIFLTDAGSVPALGTDSIGLATAQPPGSWLLYSSATRDPHALTVRYKTDASRTVIYRYDIAKSPPINTVSGQPIFEITSSGRVASALRTIRADVVAAPITPNPRGALVSDRAVTWSGSDRTCGYNHRSDTPAGTGSSGRSGLGGCNESAGEWEVGSGDLAGVWSNGTITNSSGYAAGAPAAAPSQGTAFYSGPWEALNMTPAQFWTWAGAAMSAPPAAPNGIFCLDDNGTAQDQSGAFTLGGTSGDGFLYVDGDLTLEGSFAYRGLIYVEGDLRINGGAWILGGVIVRGRTTYDNHASGTILYSRDAIVENIARYGSYATVAWREIRR